MPITLNHTIIPSKNHLASARFFERVFGFTFLQEWGDFAVVRVNDTLTLDFMNQDAFSSGHYSFKVSEQEFDQIFQRIKQENVPFGSEPDKYDDGKINTHFGGRGVYFMDLDGHLLEIQTTDYVLD